MKRLGPAREFRRERERDREGGGGKDENQRQRSGIGMRGNLARNAEEITIVVNSKKRETEEMREEKKTKEILVLTFRRTAGGSDRRSSSLVTDIGILMVLKQSRGVIRGPRGSTQGAGIFDRGRTSRNTSKSVV